jgi:uncharacterized membrane protein
MGGCGAGTSPPTATCTPRFYRAWNEVPTLAMIVIVVLVIVKPF